MNFFEGQAAARRTSARLLLLFALAVIVIVAAFELLAAWWLGPDPRVVATVAILVVGVVAGGSLYRIASLRGGGDPVALQMGGVPVPADTADPRLRRLRNVVEEIAIASGVPVPRVYVLEHEAGINAFAAGYSASDAVVAVTSGALDRLNRDELQGVVAHEFSHILNGDMRLNIRLIGVLFGILMIGLIGRRILEYGSRGRDRGLGLFAVVAVVAIAVGYVGLFFGRMIKAGVSRQRERLADASAVQFTRQTSGLAGALKKIGGVHEGSRLGDRGGAEEVSHMLFGDGVGFRGLFATHPPLLARIQALEPQFRGEQLERLQAQWLRVPPDGMHEDAHLGLDARRPRFGTAAHLPDATASFAVAPAMVSAQVARPGDDDYRRADAIAAGLPEALRDLAARRDGAMPLLLALLLDPDEAVQARQRDGIAARLGDDIAGHALRIRQQLVADLHPALRLPLASLAFPVLRMRPRPELDRFLETVEAVSLADGRLSLFEYCLGRLLRVQVRESLDPARHARFGRRRLPQVRAEVATLLGVVAQAGHADAPGARRAWLAGMQRVLPGDAGTFEPPVIGAIALERVWGPLDALDPLAKRALVEGVAAAVAHDGRLSVPEAELLRTVCGVLHCPLPPMLERT